MSANPGKNAFNKPESSGKPTGERLQKVLAAAGLGSRRACEEFITTGRVTIDGKVADNLGVRVDPETQKITVDGERVKVQLKKYYLLNKPRGCLCTNSDPAGRTRVIDLLPNMETRVFPVGRLDENTEGLLLVTNDGELAHRLAHPRYQVERIYRVLVAGNPSPEVLSQLEQGMYFEEGKFRMRHAKKLKTQGQSTLLEIVITEGQNREVRRMFARMGHKVMSLQRIQFGPLRLADMAPGEFRTLRPQELDRLRELVTSGGRQKPRPARPGSGRMSSAGRRSSGRPASDGQSGRPPRPGTPQRTEREPDRRTSRGTGQPGPRASEQRRGDRPARPPTGRPPTGRPASEGRKPYPPKRRPKRS